MSERDDERRVVLADPDSLLGMLQRGRGRGFLLASETPPQEVWPLLLECIMNDPRFDRQCEDREEYYALFDPAHRHGSGVASVARQAGRRSARRQWLEDRFRLGDPGVSGRPRQQPGIGDPAGLCAIWNRLGVGCGALGRLPASEAVEGIDEMMCRRITDDPHLYEQFRDGVEREWSWYCLWDENARRQSRALLPVCEPWKSLCRKNSGLAKLFARVGLPYDHPPTDAR